MTLWAIVPVKPLRRGKSRLSGVFSSEERFSLNRKLLKKTIRTLTDVPEIGQVLVVSRDHAALVIARDLGAKTVLEDGAPELNIALTRATIIASNYATRGVLIMPADLPLVTVGDIQCLINKSKEPPVVVISPDRHHRGTNALLVCPPGIIAYHFGEKSFEKHCQIAKDAGARLEICELPSLTLDLDIPEDLELLEDKLHKQLLEP